MRVIAKHGEYAHDSYRLDADIETIKQQPPFPNLLSIGDKAGGSSRCLGTHIAQGFLQPGAARVYMVAHKGFFDRTKIYSSIQKRKGRS